MEVITKYLVGHVIGTGTFSTVRKGLTRENRKSIALKVIRKQYFDSSTNNQCSELEVMMKLDHPCIGRLVGQAESYRELVIVIEFYAGGELGKMVEKDRSEGKLSEDTAKFQFYQVSQAVVYLHSQGICHRDIKPGNILLKEPHNRSLLKLVDFGLSKLLCDTQQMSSVVGTPWYIAPEVQAVTRTPWDSYTVKSDCWSLGVLLYVILSGDKPYVRKDDKKYSFCQVQMEEILSGKIIERVSSEVKGLVTALLNVDPVQRPTAKEILSHSWLVQDIEVCLAAEKLMWEEREISRQRDEERDQDSCELSEEVCRQRKWDGRDHCVERSVQNMDGQKEEVKDIFGMKNGQSEQDEHPIGSLVNDVESSITRKSEKNEITKNIDIDPEVRHVKIKGIVENKTNEKENNSENLKNTRPRHRSHSRKRKLVTNIDVVPDVLGRRKRRKSEVVPTRTGVVH